MALIYQATLTPNKGDLVAAWLPSRQWAPPAPISSGVSYRFDDPAGEVGMEGFLLTDEEGNTVHVPLSYRAKPLEGAQEHLLGTMDHSVLGTRWVYDGCADPVWVTALAATILTGGAQAEELVDDGETVQRREPKVHVTGTGQPGNTVPPLANTRLGEEPAITTISGDFGELVVVRRVGEDPQCPKLLTARWGDTAEDVPLAGLRRQ